MRRRNVVAVAVTATAAFGTLVGGPCLCLTPGAQPSSSPPAAAGTANLWVDADGGTCTRQATPAVYSNAAACSDFQTAYAAASYGDTVRIVGGSYGDQVMNYVTAKADETDQSDVTFIADGTLGDVTLNSITAYGLRHVTFDTLTVTNGVTLECEDASPAPTVSRGHHPIDITIQNSQFATTRSENADLLTVKDNTIGPSSAVIKIGASADTGGGNCTDEPPVNILFQDNDIHNFREASAASHMECVFVEGTQGFTFRRNKVRGCSVFSLFFKKQLAAGSYGMSNILIENNMIGHPVASAFRTAGGSAISFSGDSSTDYTDLIVRHNSINASLLVRDDLGVTFTGAVFQGNLIQTRSGSCSAGTWTGNAYLNSSVKCSGDVADGVTSGWVDVETQGEIDSSTSDPTIDYHLTLGASSIGAATTTVAEDYDGDVRPCNTTYDIGADEFC